MTPVSSLVLVHSREPQKVSRVSSRSDEGGTGTDGRGNGSDIIVVGNKGLVKRTSTRVFFQWGRNVGYKTKDRRVVMSPFREECVCAEVKGRLTSGGFGLPTSSRQTGRTFKKITFFLDYEVGLCRRKGVSSFTLLCF